jgi:hypothetical protein
LQKRQRGQARFLLTVFFSQTRNPSDMPRAVRTSAGETCFYVVNRGNGKREVFPKDGG